MRNYKILTEKERQDIFHIFKHNSIKDMSKRFGTSVTHMNNIYGQCIQRVKDQLAERERIPECRYWDTEEEIMEALTLKYDHRDLKGDELEIFKKLL